MKNTKARWVLGHLISPKAVSGNYDMVLGETPANVPGPPPHYHTGYNEVFLVVEGEMEFMVNGETRTIKAGESVDLPPNTLHTFGNRSNGTCKWVNIHSPKGFLSFFEDVGVQEDESDAMTKSIEGSVIQKVMQTAADYDMHIVLQPATAEG
jgi:mannose-6-phosphate isomerase-like protein (cupin superfamily)